ncbi:hypothetical protein D3C86_1518720 [compost metagenome]
MLHGAAQRIVQPLHLGCTGIAADQGHPALGHAPQQGITAPPGVGQPLSVHLPALIADEQGGLVRPETHQGGIVEAAGLVGQADEGRVLQGLQLCQAGFPLLAAQPGAGGVVTGRLLQLGLVAPHPVEILHGHTGVQCLIDGAGQLLLLLRGVIHLDRHFHLDQGAGREDPEPLPAPPAGGDQQGAGQRDQQT